LFTPEQFLASGLSAHFGGLNIARVLAYAFNAVEPGVAVKKYLRETPLPFGRRTFAFGLGKASCAMIQSLADEVPLVDSLVITKHASSLIVEPVTVIEGDHPIPGLASLRAGNTAINFFSQLNKDDLLLCLMSGGGSALMAAPRISLADLQALTTALLACGARIDEINTLRRHLDHLKGGGLVRLTSGARVVGLLLSDVVGDTLESIASGPTVPDPTTLADSISIIEKYGLRNKIPASIVPALTETLKPDDPIFKKVQNTIIASNFIALKSAQAQAGFLGFHTRIIHTSLQGEARDVGKQLALQLKESLQTMQRPFCLLAGGETTVTINGNGKGGRNQELALAAVDVLADLENVLLVSIATDGEDGPTDAAGAFVTGKTAQRAESLGLYAADYLLKNDAYSYFEKIDHLLKVGPSGTNVNDLVLCFAF
jgi:hydroxypyruvate reductase